MRGASKLHLHPTGHVRCLDAFLLPGAGIDGDDAALPIIRFAQVLIAQRLPRAVEPEKCRARVHDLQRAGHGLSPVVMVNDTVHPAMTPDKAVDLIEELRAKEGA